MEKRWPYYAEDEIQAVVDVLKSGKVNYWTGDHCKQFEQEYADALSAKHAIAVANGTLALELCLRALGIGPGDEVIVPCRTFMASASCVVEVGAKPVVCDIDFDSQNLTVETIAPHVNANTKAIIAVHLGGLPCDMASIMSFAKKNNLFVVEDCAQAHGAKINGKPVGAFGDMAAFSFCQDKIITTMGEGGLVVTNDTGLFKKAWSYKDHGKGYDTVYHQDHPPGFRWLHDQFGSNYRMTEAQAVVGRSQLKKLPAWQKQRARNAHLFDLALRPLQNVHLVAPPEEVTHAYYRYYFCVIPEQLKVGWSRDDIITEINKNGIWCQVGSCAEIYRERAFIANQLAPQERFANAKALGDTSIALLVDPVYSEAEVRQAAQVIHDILSKAQK